MDFQLIPDESSSSPQFTKRKIGQAGESNLLCETQKLLARYQDDDEDMLDAGEYFRDLVDIPFQFLSY